MQRLLLILMIPMLLVLSSCQKNNIVPNQTIVLDIASRNWFSLNGGRSYTTEINIPELDNYINERGGVLVYVSFGSETYEQIPQVYDGETYSFITQPGRLVLEVQRYDGVSEVQRPANMTVKIILIESDY